MAVTAPVRADWEDANSETARDRARARRAGLAGGGFLLAYVGWQLLRWTPGSRHEVGDLLVLAVDTAAVYAAWAASRRCTGSAALRAFWRLLAIAFAAESAGDVIQAAYDLGRGGSPYPSLADPFYLAFYPLVLFALLRAPVAKVTRAKLTRTVLDGATIVLGGATVVWYFVLGPTAEQPSTSVLAMAVSVAFPVGDLLLLAGLASLLMRPTPPELRAPLGIVSAALLTGIAADILYGYTQLHATYRPGDYVDTLYVIEFALFAVAGASQRHARHTPQEPDVGATAQPDSEASWLPYLAIAVGLGVLFGVERSEPFFPNVSLVLIVSMLCALVALRQHLAQRELITTQAALRRSERAKDEFLAVVGHELRTPLTSIRGTLGLLDAGVLGQLPTDAAGMVAVAVRNSDLLMRLINDILDIERMAAGRLELAPTEVDASLLASRSLQVVQAGADAAGVRLRSDVEPVVVLADEGRIVQALVNLLGNAIKFSPSGGVVTVVVRRGGQRALFSVHDSGRGIPPGRIEHVFERFEQVDSSDAREKGGAGLGLPIARGIVVAHGGLMWAESAEGEGSTFHFTLPAVCAGPARAGTALGSPAGPPVEIGLA